MTPEDIAKKIRTCYEILPNEETNKGAAEKSDAAIMEFRRERLKVASNCVFAGMELTTIQTK